MLRIHTNIPKPYLLFLNKNVNLVYLLLFLFSPSVSWAGTETKTVDGCWHNKQFIEPFDSVWIIDPVINKQYIEEYKSQGLSPEQIAFRIKNADWNGFRLICHPVISYEEVASPTKPAQSFSISGYVLTFNRYSMDYYRDIQRHLSEK